MDLITLGMGLLKFAPSIAGFFGGSGAEAKVQKVTAIAQAITGTKNVEDAIKALEYNHELALQFDKATKEYQVSVMYEETKRIEAVNRTMREEAKSDHWMQWSWRPANGYLFGITLFGNYFVLPLVSVEPATLPEPVLMAWAAVLGITAWTRGTEKANKVKAGIDISSISSVVSNALKRQK